MKEELVKIETVPAKLNELQKRKEELTKLVSETSEVVINGLHDTEGFKAAENNRKLIKKELSSIEKTRKDIKAPVLKIGIEIDEAATELKAILEPESKRLIEITDKHKKDVEAEKQRQIEEQKQKLKDRLRMIHELSPQTDGYTHSLSFGVMDVSVNNDEVEIFTDEAFNELYEEMSCIASQIKDQKRIDEEKARVERERIEKEKEAERLAQEKAQNIINIRNKELQPYIQFIRDYAKMIALPENEYKNELKEVKKGAEDQWEFQRQEQINQAKIKADQDKREAELKRKEEKVKQEAEALERERKAKEAKEFAEKQALEAEEATKKAKLKAEKEAEEKRKQDIKRQKMLAPIKDLACSFINNFSNSLHSIKNDFDNDEMKCIMSDFENGIFSVCEEYLEKINNL